MVEFKKIIEKPDDVSVNIVECLVTVKKNLDTLERKFPSHVILNLRGKDIEVCIDGNKIKDEKEGKRLLGLYSKLLQNIILGVSNPFERKIQIIGVGYKVLNNIPGVMELELGFSHSIFFVLPAGITYDVQEEKNSDTGIIVSIKGIDKYLVGQVASSIKKLRPVEPYKGKGIRYYGDVIKLKEKKTTK